MKVTDKMKSKRIMCSEDFERTFNVRLAEKCCANCKHGECEYEGCATCRHPERNDGGYTYEEGELESKYYSYNACQCNVCDLWGGERRNEMSATNNNTPKLREAIEAVIKVGYPHNFQREAPHIREYCYEITEAIEKCFAALSAPARNCDVYTTTDNARWAYHMKGDGLMTMQAFCDWFLSEAEGGAE